MNVVAARKYHCHDQHWHLLGRADEPLWNSDMTPQLHAELAQLCQRFYSGTLSDEEWALLQIHMAYCDSCHRTFTAAGRERLLSDQQGET